MTDQTTGFLSADKPVIPSSGAPPPRRRAQLYSSCAVNALLVMPAALSVGIMLAGPAGAQTTLTGQSEISLSNYEGVNSFINITGHQINGSPTGVYGDSLDTWTLTNAGTVSGEGDGSSYGIDFRNGGSIGNSGSVSGGSDGVYVKGSAGTLSNTGSITGGHTGAVITRNGSVVNAGLIEGANEGLYMYGQSFMSITNTSSGTITGARGLETHYTETLDNAGVVSGTLGLGMYLAGGGMLTNDSTGTISGTGNAILANFVPQGVLNAGMISSSDADGIDFLTGGTLTNSSSGTIQGAVNGIFDQGGSLLVQNDGLINASNGNYGILVSGSNASITNGATGSIVGGSTGIALIGEATGTVNNLGIVTGGYYGIDVTGANAYVNNQASGDTAGYILAGSVGVFISGADGSVNNAGTILAENTDYEGATAVYLSEGGRVTNDVGASILGYTYGISITGGRGIVFNNGTIDSWGDGSNGVGVLIGDGYVSNASTGTIFGGSIGVAASYSAIVENDGGISGQKIGVSLGGGGVVNNTGAVYGGGDGVLLGQYGTVMNSGTITGASPTYFHGGIVLEAGGYVNNTARGAISGYYGISATGSLSLVNAGIIAGSDLSGYGVGVGVYGNGAITNQAGGLIIGADEGLVVGGTSFNLTNAGVIEGAQYGVKLFTTAATTLVNTGTIEATGYYAFGTGVLLGEGGYLNNAAGGVIYGHSIGVDIENQSGTLVNAGMISGLKAGVLIGAGGNVTNAAGGTITGQHYGVSAMNGSGAELVLNAGSIYGPFFGVGLGIGTIVNQDGGVISGGFGGAVVISGDVTNATGGTISSGGEGVYLGGGNLSNADGGVISSGSLGVSNVSGTINNAAGGYIEGHVTGVQLGNIQSAYAGGASLLNAGTVSGTSYGVLAYGASYIRNSGLITGGRTGIGGDTAALTLTNEGLVAGGVFGVSLSAGGTITNMPSGTISGGEGGIYGQGATIQNAGIVTGTSNSGIVLLGGQLTNLAGATINGSEFGLFLSDRATASNAGVISDSGALTHAGAVLLNGADLSNLAGGTITGDTGVIINGDDGTLLNAGTIIGTDGNAIAVGPNIDPAQITLTTGSAETGTIDGAGTDGQIFLTGHDTLTNTIADFGAGSALDVAQGANWTASGDWTIADVTNDGTFQPGIIGTALTLNGNFTQSATGVLQVIVTPKVTSQFIVNGSVALAGKLTYAFAPGTYVPGKKTFLTATQGITGGFSEVDYLGDVPAALKHATGAVATAADLALTAGPTPPSPPTPPVRPAPPGPPKPPMLVTPADDGLYDEAAQAAAMATQDVSAGLLDHATMQADGGGGGGGAACAAASGVAQANAGAAGASMAARMTTAVASAFCGAGGWVAATGTAMTVDGAGYADGYRTTSGGVLAGVDAAVPGTQARLGVAVGYDNADLKDSEGGKVDIGTTRIGLYGTQMVGRFTLAGDFMVGLANDTATRPTGIGHAHAKFDGTDYAGGVQIGTAMTLRGFDLAPAAGIRIANTADAAFAESGGGPVVDFAISGEAVRDTSIQPYATLGISRPFFTPSLVAITPSVSVGYMAEAGSLGKSTTVTAPDGTGFAASSPMLDGGAAALGAGVTAGKGNWSLYAHYTAYVAGRWSTQSGEAGLQLRF